MRTLSKGMIMVVAGDGRQTKVCVLAFLFSIDHSAKFQRQDQAIFSWLESKLFSLFESVTISSKARS